MKVLFGSLSALNLLEGGAKTQVLMLKRYLERLGVEVSLFQDFTDYPIENFFLFHLFAAEGATYHLTKVMKSLGLKLVVSPIFFSRHNPFSLKILNAPFSLLRRFSGVWTEPLYVKEICEMADLVCPNTEREKMLLTKGLGIKRDKVFVIPNGVEERFYYAQPDLFYRTYGIRDFILYTGHIGWGRKNLLPLLKVLKRLRYPAVLIGKIMDNEYAKRCLEIAEGSEWIKIIDHLPHSSLLLESAYAAASVFVLPSLYETPGLSALEAGLAGAKVVITKFGGTEEYFKDFAIYINPYSEKEIEDGIKEALEKKKDSRLKEHIRENFLWSKSAEKLVRVYKRITELTG